MKKAQIRPLKTALWAGLLLVCAHVTLPAQEVAWAGPGDRLTGKNQDGSPERRLALPQALKGLEQKFDVRFLYRLDAVAEKYVAAPDLAAGTLPDLLATLLKPLGLAYQQIDPTHYAIVRDIAPLKAKGPTLAQTSRPIESTGAVRPLTSIGRVSVPVITITGAITDEGGGALPGVNVVLKGTTSGTTADADGRYSLSLPDGSGSGTLVFSFIGFRTQEVPIGNRTVINVTLAADVEALGEVVVVGYGTQQRRDLTGAIGSISEKEIKAVPVNTFQQALQGRVAGVQVQQSNGAPGGGVQIRVRGVGSITQNSEPLYVVDGIPLYGNDFNNARPIAGQAGSGDGTNPGGSVLASINPNDIEAIEILKDASATAIYGSRGANGVVIITTKRGKAGRANVTVNAYYGLQEVRKLLPLANGYQFARMQNEARLNNVNGDRINGLYTNPYSFGKGTDWQDEVFRIAPMQNYNASITGGSEKTQFALSGDYFDQQGIIINTGFRRISARANIDHQATKRLKAGISLAPSYQYGNILNTDNVFGGRLIGALRAQPTLPVYGPDGTTYAGIPPNTDFGETRNVVAEFNRDVNDLRRFRTLGNLYGELTLLRGLTFRSSFGGDIMYTKQQYIEPIYRLFGGQQNPTVRTRTNNSDYINYNAEQLLTYNGTFGQRHNLNALLGFQAQSFISSNIFGDARGATNNALTTYSNNTLNQSFGGDANRAGLVSYFARAFYSFDDRYLLTATIRTDGSSRFGPGRRWGTFPSGSLGWRISREPFMQGINAIQDLKFRVSYGLTGNQDISDFQYLARAESRDYVFGNSVAPGVAPSSFANPNLQWEAQKQFDVGVDFSLLGGRVNVTADYYVKTSDELLLNVELPGAAGASPTILFNLGEVQNRGFEFDIRTQNLTGDFRWSTDFNFSTLENKITSLGTNPGGGRNEYLGRNFFIAGQINKTVEGRPISAFWVFEADGIYQNFEEIQAMNRDGSTYQEGLQPGDIRYKDQDGNGILDDKDRIFAGSPFPNLFGGLNNTFEYKGFSLNVFASFSSGNKIYNSGRANASRDAYWNMDNAFMNAWRPDNTDTDVPRLAGGGSHERNTRPSTRFLEDGSFIRVRNINLSYNLPAGLSQRLLLQSARVYVSATNALTFTRYTGYDPEVNGLAGNPQNQGIDLIGYPLPRVLTMGVTATF